MKRFYETRSSVAEGNRTSGKSGARFEKELNPVCSFFFLKTMEKTLLVKQEKTRFANTAAPHNFLHSPHPPSLLSILLLGNLDPLTRKSNILFFPPSFSSAYSAKHIMKQK
ncbi:hypothetical protein, unlikely [Trypanosoma brucei gambiense DAL972]|uniref:Uncharacterized protein n=1 Tax=Trypanosoma brucei gambiense (strain MHOM/CI/86/DAL972) TaxID=679716 RepID=C9ZLS3_TRYB9|nr:hypothetical protein, unlikely [Trypanosoma brucei gambiense DAL972]CBH10348.1 hypothetical protein, unlikely [Trypanosoma brucei gambiense DAL972]|eukprot:XP_011772638.1 hypothetical protein, unlikely [Trypanosoma brucei gambiense DAL972]